MCEKHSTNFGDHSMGDPPVLIPNTVVKPHRAESTWLDTAREDMLLPDTKKALGNRQEFFFYIPIFDSTIIKICRLFESTII